MTMASWQCVACLAALVTLGAYAEDTVLGATTVANSPSGAFIYVPDPTVEGQVAVNIHSPAQSNLTVHTLHACMDLE